MTGTYQDLLDAIAVRESSDNYSAVNTLNYLGRYQMGEAALIDAGYVLRDGNYADNNYSGGWTGKDGVYSVNDFLNNHTAQDNAVEAFWTRNWTYIKHYKLESYIGTEVNGIEITVSGMLAGAHLSGIGDLMKFLKSNGAVVPTDGYGTPITEYLQLFQDYDTPFTPGDDYTATVNEWIDFIHAEMLEAAAKASPLVLDLDGDGIETTALNGNDDVYFDHDQDGFAEASGWVTGGDGFLALDINEDGMINDGAELFGNQTGQGNGFLSLAQYDNTGDSIITGEDVVWNDLRVWIDLNNDGKSQDAELHTLDSLGITAIDLAYTNVSTTNNGNDIKQTGSFTINGNSRAIADVYFAVDKVNSTYVEDFDLDVNALHLPALRGYGQLADLPIAMSLDNSGSGNLFELVDAFSEDYSDFADLFAATSDVVDDVRAILYRWADVEAVNSAGRGPNVDGQELAFLEKLTGQPFLQQGVYSNPKSLAGQDLTFAFNVALNKFSAQLMAQVAGAELFEGDVSYNVATDSFDGITGLNLTKLAELEMEATGLANTAARATFWQNVVRMIEYTIGTDNLDSGDETALADSIYDSDASLNLTGILESVVDEPTFANTTGTSGNDTLNGSAAMDDIQSYAGNDVLNGGGGNDILNAGNDDDTLTGGTGSDLLNGGTGNDIYIYASGDGEDVIVESGGTDEIRFAAGIVIGDLSFARAGATDLVISIDNGVDTGEIIIQNQFNNTFKVETIRFSDNSTFDLTTQNYTLTATSASETLYGVSAGGGINDTIYAGAGNDEIYGYAGDDVLYGEDGNDYISGSSGADTIYGGAGNDEIHGGDDNDILHAGTGNDIIYGGSGNDTYYYTSGHAKFGDGGSGTDAIYLAPGYSSGSTVYYKIGYDMKIVLDANNSILLVNQFSSSAAIETLHFDGGPSVTLSSVSYQVQGDDGNNNLSGSANADVLYGMGGNDTLYGGAGNDILYGGLGNDDLRGEGNDDTLEGGAGDDEAQGGSGNDTYIYTSGHDLYAETSSGTDKVKLIDGWDLSDLTFKRVGHDLIIEISSVNSITLEDHFYSTAYNFETLEFFDTTSINLLTKEYITYGTNSGQTINGISSGGSVNDTIYALDGNDTVYGNAGNDILYGGNGNDRLLGGNDNDILYGDAGDDDLEGGAGNDTYVYSSGLDTFYDSNTSTDKILITGGTTINDITVSQSGSHATIVIDAGVNEILAEWVHYSATYQIEKIEFDDGFITNFMDHASWTWGTSGADSLTGTSSHNVIIGKDGNDTLDGAGGDDDIHGGVGNDTLYGGSGIDLLHGGAGNDTLYGQDGLDTLYGGAGADTFVFQSATAFNNIDVIKDFNAADNDILDISDLLVGYTGMSDINDFMSLSVAGGNTTVLIDRDGAGGTYSSQSVMTLNSVTGLDVDDLLNNGNLIV